MDHVYYYYYYIIIGAEDANRMSKQSNDNIFKIPGSLISLATQEHQNCNL